MTITEIINKQTFSYTLLNHQVEVYLTKVDSYLQNNLEINADLMIVVLYQAAIELTAKNDQEKIDQEKEKLRNNFLVFCEQFKLLCQQGNAQKIINIEIIDPATGYPLDNSANSYCETIDIPRVISRLANNCYEYNECCQGKHRDWGQAVYPSLMLLSSTTPAEIIPILNQLLP